MQDPIKEITANEGSLAVSNSLIGISGSVYRYFITTNGIMEFESNNNWYLYTDFEFTSLTNGKHLVFHATNTSGVIVEFNFIAGESFESNIWNDIIKIWITDESNSIIPVWTCKQIEVHNNGLDNPMYELEMLETDSIAVKYHEFKNQDEARHAWINGVRVFLYHGAYYELESDPGMIKNKDTKFYTFELVKKPVEPNNS